MKNLFPLSICIPNGMLDMGLHLDMCCALDMPCGARRDAYHIESIRRMDISNLPQGKYIDFAERKYRH